MGDSLSVPPERSAANLFIIVHVVYAKTKKMADKSRLNDAVVFLVFILNISAANLSGFVRWKNDVFFYWFSCFIIFHFGCFPQTGAGEAASKPGKLSYFPIFASVNSTFLWYENINRPGLSAESHAPWVLESFFS